MHEWRETGKNGNLKKPALKGRKVSVDKESPAAGSDDRKYSTRRVMVRWKRTVRCS
jgi:hypothetical protein